MCPVRARPAIRTAASALLVAALGGCGEGGGATTGAAPNAAKLDALTCADLQANGGALLVAAATELARKVTSGPGADRVAGDLQTILISGCRQEPSGFRPAQPALTLYGEQHPSTHRKPGTR
jgi:hypothetical protein